MIPIPLLEGADDRVPSGGGSGAGAKMARRGRATPSGGAGAAAGKRHAASRYLWLCVWMVFSEITGTLAFLQPQPDDDISDRLHYYYTTTFLLLTSVLVSLKMFGGRPIECWLPAEYKKSWEDYTEMYCWARSTYFAPFEEELPEVDQRGQTMVSYYQWVPFFFVLVAVMFYAPCLIWRLMYDKSGIRLKDIMSFANDKSNVQPASRRANIHGLAAHLSSIFKHRFTFGGSPHKNTFFRLLNLRFYEAFLTYLYIFIKFLFLVNVILQMFLLNKFLQTDAYGIYGFGVIADLLSGKAWTESANFPVVTYCDMQIRILGNVQRHTVQCVLVINIFTEKIFIMLWIWYTLLAVISFGSITSWIFQSLPFEQRKKFIIRRLELADVDFKRHSYEAELDEFVRDFIKMDGIFVLRMITIHSGVLVCTEVVDLMWDQYLAEIGERDAKFIGQMLHYPDLDPDPHGKLDDMLIRPHSAAGLSFDLGKYYHETPPLRRDNASTNLALLARRKQSVLVPLVSREDLTNLSDTGNHYNHLRPPSSRGGGGGV